MPGKVKPIGMSERAFARHAGVSYDAVRYAKLKGKLVLHPDGSIDPAPSLERMLANTNPARVLAGVASAATRARQRRNAPADLDAAPASNGNGAPALQVLETMPSGTDGLPDAIASSLDAIRRAASHLDYNAAQTLAALVRAYNVQLQAAKTRGELVDRVAVEKLVTAQATAERNSWLTWPSRVAALIAAEVGADAGQMQAALERYVRAHLTELGSAELDLSQLGQAKS